MSLPERVADLERMTGVPAGRDHHRHALYQRAAADPATHAVLRAALAEDPDRPLVAAVVVALLPELDWIELLDGAGEQAYARRRQAEFTVLARARAGELSAAEALAAISGWSDWLQRGLVALVTDPALRRVLAGQGRTRKVRQAASAR